MYIDHTLFLHYFSKENENRNAQQVVFATETFKRKIRGEQVNCCWSSLNAKSNKGLCAKYGWFLC